MKGVTIIGLLCVFAISCETGPQPGEVYENKLTGERIKVEKIGTRPQLEQKYRADSVAMHRAVKVVDSTYAGVLLAMTMTPLVPKYEDYEDSTEICVSYHEPQQTSERYIGPDGRDLGRVTFLTARLIPLQELEQDYSLVE